MPSQTIKLPANEFVDLVPLLDANESYVVQPTSGQIRLKEIDALDNNRSRRGGHVVGLEIAWYITVSDTPIWVWSVGVPAVIEVSND